MTSSSHSRATILESSIILVLSAIILIRLTHVSGEDPRLSTVTTLQSSANPAGTSDSVVLTASVHRDGIKIETGTVRYYNETDRWLLGVANAASPSIMVSGLKPGPHVIRAHYSGVPDYSAYSVRPSISAPLTQTVLVSPKVELSALRESSAESPLITLTAMVNAQPGQPAGSVTFRAGERVLAKRTLDRSGSAVFITSVLEEGEHLLSAEYHGDDVFAPAAALSVSGMTNMRRPERVAPFADGCRDQHPAIRRV